VHVERVLLFKFNGPSLSINDDDLNRGSIEFKMLFVTESKLEKYINRCVVLPWFRHMKPTKTLHAFDSVACCLWDENCWSERLCLLELWCVESACGEGVAN